MPNLSNVEKLVSWECHDKETQIWRLNKTEPYSLTALEATSLKAGCQQGPGDVLPEGSRRQSFASLSFCWSQVMYVYQAQLQLQPPPSQGMLHSPSVSWCLLLVSTVASGLRAHPNSTGISLQESSPITSAKTLLLKVTLIWGESIHLMTLCKKYHLCFQRSKGFNKPKFHLAWKK